MALRLSNIQLRQPVHDLHCLKAHGDDAEEEFEGVGGVVHRLGGPEVAVADDTAVFVGGDTLAFHDPFEGGFAVDDVGVGGWGDVADIMPGIFFSLFQAAGRFIPQRNRRRLSARRRCACK